MCGIAALIGENEEREIREMTRLAAHRGPDGEGIKLFPFGALGHRRLSILDLSELGSQPFCDPSGRYWITYNGEIYNYLELRSQLKALGHSFHTGTDTEVLLTAWIEWGEGALQKFNGMFAFVIFDTHSDSFFAARDRFGVKPLYYYQRERGVAFASEIKQFTALNGWKATVNHSRARDFLCRGVIDHTPETLFSGVRQLEGGFLMQGSAKNFMVKRWYDPKPKPFEGSFEEAAELFCTLLSDAVRLRLRADVEVGSCLSGGLDSSSIVCLMANALADKKMQKTFSAVSPIARFDESPYMMAVIEKVQVEHFTVAPEAEELLKKLDEIVYYQDEPFATTSVFAQWKVFELVKSRGVKVMLDGQGADEQMGGYHTFFGNHFYELFRSLRLLHLLKEVRAAKRMHPGLKCWRRLAALMIPWRKVPRGFNEHLYLQTTRTNLPMLLHLEDRDSMAHSVESRTPFLDYRLVELSLSLPHHFQIRQGVTKQVLRAGMEGILPEKIARRVDKLGFATPESHWALQHFERPLHEALEHSSGYVEPGMKERFERMRRGKIPYSSEVWRVISFGAWLRRFF